MRFEIKTGGWILIGLGLGALSFVVFALGLFAGYDMARNTAPEASQAASVYPLPNSPAPEIATSPPKSPEVTTSKQPVTAKVASKPGGGVSSTSSLSMDKDAGPVAPSSHTLAKPAAAPAPKIASADTDEEEKPSVTNPAAPNSSQKYASVTDSSGGRHKPFNIQIDAVMDRANAEQMTTRLQKLGYRAFMVPTDISGQTWWRVRVGPYQSEDEASAAEQELRAKYKDTYTP